MSDKKLKPCPFCNSTASQYRDLGNGKYYIVCDICLAGQDGFIIKELSIERWNTRPNQGLVPISAEEVKKWWRFDNNQMPMSSYHDREDFIKQCATPAPRRVTVEELEEVIESLHVITDESNHLTEPIRKGFAQAIARHINGDKE